MDSEKVVDVDSKSQTRPNPMLKKVGIYGAVLLVVFLLGFIPMWLIGRQRSQDLAETQRQLKISQLQNVLGSGVIDSKRGEYEPARKSASDFFTGMRAELELENLSSFTEAQRNAVRPMMTQRDEVITLLSRGDTASPERLSDLYVMFRNAIGETK